MPKHKEEKKLYRVVRKTIMVHPPGKQTITLKDLGKLIYPEKREVVVDVKVYTPRGNKKAGVHTQPRGNKTKTSSKGG